MIRDYRDYLEDILTSIAEASDFTAGMSSEDFRQDRKTINAVLRSLEVLGEAAKRIPDDLRARASEIPWRRMTAMRDKLIHEYFGVDLSIVWNVVQKELPAIHPKIAKLLADLELEQKGKVVP